jgi:two-component system sensor histidine kinase/response regulator
MDVQLPFMDGLEATRRIRQEIPGGARVPIVGLTANALKEQVEACRAAGMDEVIAKPIERERLEAVIERYAPSVGTRTGRYIVKSGHEPVSAERRAPVNVEISLARFREVTMGDDGLARGLVGTFRQSAGRACEEIQSGIENGDFELARRAAHTLAGASANMGASRLEALAAAMEQAAIQRDGAALRPLAEAARTRLNAALTELNSLT